LSERIPVVVLGGSGYVAGEVVRLLATHPGFALAAVVSESRGGAPVVEAFPHLAGTIDGLAFTDFDALPALFAGAPPEARRFALVSAAPHGASAALVARAIDFAERAAVALSVVDLSADFRFAAAADYQAVYGHPHPAPGLLERFVRALPEHSAWTPGSAAGVCVAHPGCFTTSVLLAVVPLLALGLAEPRFAVTAITGSSGSGRSLSDRTHHPARRSNIAAYSPLAHRHAPEMTTLAGEAAGVRPTIDFVPLSGPQARGIYAAVQGRLAEAGRDAGAAEIAGLLAGFYAGSPFVSVGVAPPSLTEVVGTNRARIGVACAGESFALTVAIDNLVKGAAGGAVQWLNRIYGFEATDGLGAASLGWF
jgi:N-acetyl-gamma-glutamyl-phosphate reductase common form